jgi:hypothetical protein
MILKKTEMTHRWLGIGFYALRIRMRSADYKSELLKSGLENMHGYSIAAHNVAHEANIV